MGRQLTFFIPNVCHGNKSSDEVGEVCVDRTLSSLTLLEDEPWFPFFGGMVSQGKSGGLDYQS